VSPCQALGSRVGKRRKRKRKRRQHPRGLNGLAPWLAGPESMVAGTEGQEERLQDLWGVERQWWRCRMTTESLRFSTDNEHAVVVWKGP
jgi:hypothetical protein